MASKKGPPSDPGQFDEAVNWFKARVPMRKDEWLLLSDQARRKASTVAGVAQVDVINDVMKELERALTKGETLEDFRARVKDKLTAAWGGTEIPGRVETIFRTNVQHAYSHGRRAQMTTPAMMKIRPYWRFTALLDMRTTTFCRPIDGTVLPATHPFWNRHTPPLHFNCRSAIISMRASVAEEEGITEDAPTAMPQEGFGSSDPLTFQPDITKYAKDLQKAYVKKEGKPQAPPPEPAKPKDVPPPFGGPDGAKWAQEFPQLARTWGSKLWVKESEDTREQLTHLASLPVSVQKQVADTNAQLHFGPGSLQDFKKVSPKLEAIVTQSNKSSRKASEVGGVWYGAREGAEKNGVLVVGTRQRRGPAKLNLWDKTSELGVTRHEFGHAFDLTMEKPPSRDEAFVKAWREMYEGNKWGNTNKHVNGYFLQKATRVQGDSKWTVGCTETFAESFSKYYEAGGGEAGRAAVEKAFTKPIADLIHKRLHGEK